MANRVLSVALSVATVLSIGTAGCGRSETSRPARPVENFAKPKSETMRPEVATISGPADALNGLCAGLAEGRTERVLAAVPERYRRDLDRLLATTVRPIDPAARKSLADSVETFAGALNDKAAFVLASKRIEMAGPAADLARGRFAAVCRLVAATAAWPGWGRAEGLDAESLLGVVIAAVAADAALAGDLRDVRFEPISESGDDATVRIVSGSGEKGGAELAVVRIDGKWLPAAVAERWEAVFAARRGDDSVGEGGGDLVGLATRIDEVAEALREVSTQAEFDALADHAATLLLATAAQGDQAPRPVRAEEFVTVEVIGRMTDEQKDRLVWELAAATDAPSSGLADATDRLDGMAVTVGPVADVETFAKRLTGLHVERVDRNEKTVTTRFAGP